MSKKISILSISSSKFGKTSLSVLELSKQTAKECLNNFDKKKIDLLVFSSFAAERYTQEFHLAAKLADELGLSKNCFCLRTETASSSGASALHTALQSGAYSNALVVASEVMSSLLREDLFFIAEKLHANGALNPKAHFQKKITFQDYEKAPIFAESLRLYDISPIVASRLAQIVELVNFMKEKNFRYGLTHSISDLATNNFMTILENKV